MALYVLFFNASKALFLVFPCFVMLLFFFTTFQKEILDFLNHYISST